MLTPEPEKIGKIVVNSAFTVHKELGPGLLEKVYEACLAYEIRKSGLLVERQIGVPIVYDGLHFKEGLRLDLLVEKEVIVEVKAIENVNPVWDAQVISHLKLTNKQLGFLVNFNVALIKNGIKRFVNQKRLFGILPGKIKKNYFILFAP
jgi:GxxExxY protein